MCVKLPPRDLNLGSCPPYSTNTYTCEVTTVPRVRGGTCLICFKYSDFNNMILNQQFKC